MIIGVHTNNTINMKDIFLHMEWWRWVLLCTIMPASIIGSVFIIRGLYKNLFCNPEPDEKVFTPTSDCTSTSKEHKDTTSHDSGLHATAAGSAIIFTAANM